MGKDKINLDEPRWDQSTYMGRFKHFFAITNPRNLFASSKKLEETKEIINKYKSGKDVGLDEEELWKAKHLYDSAFHPDTGEKMIIIGRMSANVPCNTFITGGMLTFYSSNIGTIFFQWLNQSYNAIINFTNRGGDSPISVPQLGASYLLATSGAIGSALYLNRVAKKFSPLVQKGVPLIAVCVGNFINIPIMRFQELKAGTPIQDEKGNKLGDSRNAAINGISQVIFSRTFIAATFMIPLSLIMDKLETLAMFKRYGYSVSIPVQTGLAATILLFGTPAGCALFSQKASIKVSSLEKEVQEKIEHMDHPPEIVYFNKGL